MLGASLWWLGMMDQARSAISNLVRFPSICQNAVEELDFTHCAEKNTPNSHQAFFYLTSSLEA